MTDKDKLDVAMITELWNNTDLSDKSVFNMVKSHHRRDLYQYNEYEYNCRLEDLLDQFYADHKGKLVCYRAFEF